MIEQKFPKEGSETYESIQIQLCHAFREVQRLIKINLPNTADKSGSAACILIAHGHKLITANVGNSKAILVNKYRKIRLLTEDQSVTRNTSIAGVH